MRKNWTLWDKKSPGEFAGAFFVRGYLRGVCAWLRGVVIVFVIQIDELLLICGDLIFREDSVYWANRFASCAVDTFIWADEKLVVTRL